MKVEHRSPTATAEDLVDVLAANGCVVVDDLADAGLLARIEVELAPYIEKTPFGSHSHMGLHTRRTGALVARSPSVRRLVVDPLVLKTACLLLAPFSPSVQLHLTQLIDIGPGETAQTIHCDQWEFSYPFPVGTHVQCGVMWAVTDFTAENGATRMVPGSNQWPERREVAVADTVPVEMSRGSVLLFTGSVYHGGGANVSDEHRRGLNVGYSVSWLRQEENQYLSCPPDVAATLPEFLQRLVGYSMSGSALGYFGDVRPPREALLAEANRPSAPPIQEGQ
jgi:hypothetical protein